MKVSYLMSSAFNVMMMTAISALYAASVMAKDVNEVPLPRERPSTEIECLAKNVYFEARNQSTFGQLAVAMVTMNRVEDKRFPNSVCEVVYQNRQFSWTHLVNDHTPKERQSYKEIYRLAQVVYNGEIEDITSGSAFYHATYIKQPRWAKRMKKIGIIDQHIFYKG